MKCYSTVSLSCDISNISSLVTNGIIRRSDISNISSLSPKTGVKYSLKNSITNISGMSYQEIGEVFLKCMMAENSIIRGNTGIKSHLGMMTSSLANLYPIINGDNLC